MSDYEFSNVCPYCNKEDANGVSLPVHMRFCTERPPEQRLEIWVPTYSGRRLNVLDPKPEDIIIRDIAEHLGKINRYLGASVRPLSVAEHSVRLFHVLAVLEPANRSIQRDALMHDAAEAYLGEVVAPLKRTTPLVEYRRVEGILDRGIRERFGLSPFMGSRVGELDKALAKVEMFASGLFTTEFMVDRGRPTGIDNGTDEDANRIAKMMGKYPYSTWGWPWEEAVTRFLAMADELNIR